MYYITYYVSIPRSTLIAKYMPVLALAYKYIINNIIFIMCRSYGISGNIE